MLNALNNRTITELEGAVSRLTADDEVRVVILTGAGDRAFIAGADIRELAELNPVTAEALAARGHALCHALERMGKPVIAAVQRLRAGRRLRAGHGLHAAHRGRYGEARPAGDRARPVARLRRHAAPCRGWSAPDGPLEMTLTGEPVDAQEAWRIGLVNRVVPRADLMATTMELAQRIAAQAPVAVRCILAAVRDGLGMTLADGCAHEASLFGLPAATSDWAEGTARVSREAPAPVYRLMRDTPVIEGATDASGLRVGLIVSAYHRAVTAALCDGALEALRDAGARGAGTEGGGSATVIEVPGAFEIPLAARRAAESGNFDAVVCLGCIVRGETPHFDYLASAVAHAIAAASQADRCADDVRSADHEHAGRGRRPGRRRAREQGTRSRTGRRAVGQRPRLAAGVGPDRGVIGAACRAAGAGPAAAPVR